MPVGPPRRHHGNTNVFNHFVERVEFGHHVSLRVRITRRDQTRLNTGFKRFVAYRACP